MNSKINYKIQYMYMHSLCQPRPCTADHVLIYLAYTIVAIRHLNIICLTTAKFKPPILPVLGFTLSNVVSIFTVMMTSACYLQLAVWCMAWKPANSAKKTILLALQFQKRHEPLQT